MTAAAEFEFGVGTFGLAEHWLCLGVMLVFSAVSWKLSRQRRLQRVEKIREQGLREELEAYARLNVLTRKSLGGDSVEEAKTLAKRVCRTIADKSAFTRVAMLLRDAEGHMFCASSAGVDDLTVQALLAWGEDAVAKERSSGLEMARGGRRVANEGASFPIKLGEWAKFDKQVSEWELAGNVERRRWRRGIVAPIRQKDGRLLGVLTVCMDGDRRDAAERRSGMRLEDRMAPIELLASRIAVSMENEAMSERLLRAEKLAGLGQLAGGVAHALNNPLTAVLGFAELIAESSNEERVRKDAETIRVEALRMRDTVQRLTEFWRPNVPGDQAIEMAAILHELGEGCRGTLEERGVELTINCGEDLPELRGSVDRMKQVMEHLLNNAAQSIATVGERPEGHSIRVNVTHTDSAVHLIVSDTGTGFAEPGRVFDPFYTTKEPGVGLGLGLSICYGIVREHGGEISAFNLHPHGAAVVVELPVKKTVKNWADVVEMKVA